MAVGVKTSKQPPQRMKPPKQHPSRVKTSRQHLMSPQYLASSANQVVDQVLECLMINLGHASGMRQTYDFC